MSKEAQTHRSRIATMSQEIVDNLPEHWFGKVTVEDVVNALQYTAIVTAIANSAEFLGMSPEAVETALATVKEIN